MANTSAPRVRPLQAQFLELIAPKLPKISDQLVDVQALRSSDHVKNIEAGKQRALNTVWTHLRDEVTIESISHKTRDGHELEMRIYTPKNSEGSNPAVLSFHGGGFVAGTPDAEDLINRQYCRECNVTIFSTSYRLCPENELCLTVYADAEDALRWVFKNAPSYKGDLSKGIVVSGTSAGGLLALVIAYRGPRLGFHIRGWLARQPAFFCRKGPYKEDWKEHIKSWDENWDAPILSGALGQRILDFIPVSERYAMDPWYFPGFADAKDLAVMPPGYIAAAGCDPTVDETILVGRLLNEAGVPTIVKVYEGLPHGFHSLHALDDARREMVETADGMKWLLEQSHK